MYDRFADELLARDPKTGKTFRLAVRGHVTKYHEEFRDGEQFVVVDDYEIDSIDLIPEEETCDN